MLGFNGGVVDQIATSTMLGAKLKTNGGLFEQLHFPIRFFTRHPGTLEVCINDGTQRTTSICHNQRSSVAPYLVTPTAVPCVPKVPSLVVPTPDPCKAATTGSKRAPLKPYVNYYP